MAQEVPRGREAWESGGRRGGGKGRVDVADGDPMALRRSSSPPRFDPSAPVRRGRRSERANRRRWGSRRGRGGQRREDVLMPGYRGGGLEQTGRVASSLRISTEGRGQGEGSERGKGSGRPGGSLKVPRNLRRKTGGRGWRGLDRTDRHGVSCLPPWGRLRTGVPRLTRPRLPLGGRRWGEKIGQGPLPVEDVDDESEHTPLYLGSGYRRGGRNESESRSYQMDVAVALELDPFDST
jgi:hypothetical protein